MKKKIFMMTLAACLIVLSIVGTSLAYFTDTDAKTNVFVAGNVNIELTYDETDTRLYPGQTYEKVATIENVGTENAYVGLIIEVVTNDSSTFNWETIEGVFTVSGADTTAYAQTAEGYAIYAVFNAALTTTEGDKATLTTNMAIPAAWNTEMAAFNNLTVNVTAYATQTVGFDSAEAALEASFPEAW